MSKNFLPLRERSARPLVCHSNEPKSDSGNKKESSNMFNPKTGWCDSPDHVRPGASRREFLYVGMIGGLGLTLGDYIGIKSQQALAGPAKVAEVDKVENPKATADAVIHIFLP